jgi:hypothetical protein
MTTGIHTSMTAARWARHKRHNLAHIGSRYA